MFLIPLEYATRIVRKSGERPRDRAFGDYVRWEYPPAERTYVILGARGGAIMHLARAPAKKAVPPRTGRLTRWLRAFRKQAPAPTRTGDEAPTE